MLGSRLAGSAITARPSIFSDLHRLLSRPRPNFFSSSSAKKPKEMAGVGTPQRYSRTRASPRPRISVSAGKFSLNNDDGLHKPKNATQQRQIYRDNMDDEKCKSHCSGKRKKCISTDKDSGKNKSYCAAKHKEMSRERKGDGFSDGIHGARSLLGENLHRQISLESVGSNIMRNPQSESAAARFDICKTESIGPVVLKQSLLELNRAKRKDAGRRANVGPQYIHPRPGMILLKKYISHQDQVKIIQKCQRLGLGLGGFYRPGYANGAKLHLHMMCLGMNWDPQSSSYNVKRPIDGEEPPKIPVDFINLVNGSIESSHNFLRSQFQGVNAEAEIPKLTPDICIVNFYDDNGRLGLHQDKDESEESLRKGLPVVSFSLGDSAEFRYGDDRNDTEAVTLESGDVLIFGGSSRHIFHGVSSIFPQTAPNQLIQDTCMRPGRLNLTFRQY